VRYLILSDIHANLEALEACLADAGTRKYDRSLVLGDLIGYGADPDAVIDRIQQLQPMAVIRGNHDKVAFGLEQADGFNTTARNAARWTIETLSPAHREWLIELPAGPLEIDDLLMICHGSPIDEDAYIIDELDALRALRVMTRPLCLFGHTHYPVIFELEGDFLQTTGPATDGETRLEIRKGVKYLVNPGSVGQPRDGDPRAGYAIVDGTAGVVELVRINYAVDKAQAKVIDAGLPEVLARRLAAGR
jgi:diadenosine tetraphosphatase ApaH/serine/threonine PP2A family protein phosphatase